MKKTIITLGAFFAFACTDLQAKHVKTDYEYIPNEAKSVKVTDEFGEIVGRYVYEGTTQEGYRYGTFTAEFLRIAPYSVIENSANQGTPVWLAVQGATDNLVGYIKNPKYKKAHKALAGSPSKKIMLFRYDMPIEIIQPIYVDMPDQEEQTIMPEMIITIQDQDYD